MNRATKAFINKAIEFLELAMDDEEFDQDDLYTIQNCISDIQKIKEAS